MASTSPLVLLLMLAAGIYVARLWWLDFRAAQAGTPVTGALPGATTTTRPAVILAAVGAVVIVTAETLGENALGLTAEQSEMTVLLGLYTLIAAVIEEIIFRGYLVIEGRGAGARWAGILGASLVFAALHPFLWRWEDAGWEWTLNAKGMFSTAAVFVSSLWFYAVRFLPNNPSRSLWPCFAAHATKNAAVFAIKGAQGFVVGWW